MDSVWASIAAGPALCGPPRPALQPKPQATDPKCQKRAPSQLKTAEERRAASRKNLDAANLRVQEQTLERRAIYEANPRLCNHCAAPLSYKRVTKEGARFCNRSCSGSHNGKIRGPVSPATASNISAGVRKSLYDKGWRELSPYTGRQLEVHQRAVASKNFPTADWPVAQFPYAQSFFFEVQRTMQACRVRLYASDVDWESLFNSPSEATAVYTGWLVTVDSIPSTPGNVLPSVNLRISNSHILPGNQNNLDAVVTSDLGRGYNQDGTHYLQAFRRDDGGIALLDYDVIMDDQLVGWRIPYGPHIPCFIDWEPVIKGNFGVGKLASVNTTTYRPKSGQRTVSAALCGIKSCPQSIALVRQCTPKSCAMKYMLLQKQASYLTLQRKQGVTLRTRFRDWGRKKTPICKLMSALKEKSSSGCAAALDRWLRC